MLKLGPIVLLTKTEYSRYRTLTNAAYTLHQILWFRGENNPPVGGGVEEADQTLADAISHITPPPS